jgi:hypothetical protein
MYVSTCTKAAVQTSQRHTMAAGMLVFPEASLQQDARIHEDVNQAVQQSTLKT